MRGESCRFTWLVKTCIPTPNDTSPTQTTLIPIPKTTTTTISALPDDILLDCLSRVPSSSLLSLSKVCLRWAHLLLSPFFLSLRRTRRLLLPSVFALSVSEGYLAVSSLPDLTGPWRVGPSVPWATSLSLSHSRLAAVGPRVYVVGREGTLLCYDSWSGEVTVRSPMPSPARRFAAASVSGRIYVAGGGNEVEEYDPVTDVWRVAAHAPRRRYGCIGASVDGVLYLIGGLKVGSISGGDISRAAASGAVEAHVYAGSMDLYDVEVGGVWLRSRAVPGGGCVVAACAAAGQLYVLASHAVELSFWRFDARRKGRDGSVGGGGGWSRLRSPPLPTQVRLDNTIRFSCVGVDNKVVLIQVIGSIDDLLRRSGRSKRGIKEGLVLIYDSASGEWTRGADLPEAISRAACVSVEY